MKMTLRRQTLIKAFLALFLLALAPAVTYAQNGGEGATDTTVTPDDTAGTTTLNPNYGINYSLNAAAGDRAWAVLNARLPRPAVPHLDPIKVRNAMSNGTYVGNFTFVIGHRGYHSAPGCPENSACALAAAYDAGADATEFDVKITALDANGYRGVVFGHDYTVGREQSAWGSKTLSGNWNFFQYFPNPDPAYTIGKITSPFGIAYGSNNDVGVNDTRASIAERQQAGDLAYNGFGNWTLRDTFGTTTPNLYELNLYQYLYLAQAYYPVMPWLDIKSKADLTEVGLTIKQAQTDFAANGVGAANGTGGGAGSGGPVHAIAFKLGPNILLGSASKNFSDRVTSIRSFVGVSDVSYFFVFGTGDLDNMATLGQTLATCNNSCTTQQAVLNAFKSICQISDGCLGAELNHKYLNAPTQTLFNQVQALASTGVNIASFQTVPQYDWYWQSLSQAQQVTNYGAYSGRTDGSCCFSLLQPALLNSSTNFGAETGDSRPDFAWNENNFTTITTDEPSQVLKDLWVLGKRPAASVTALAATGSTVVESGGADVGIITDGLYALIDYNSRLAVDVSGSSTTAGAQLIQNTVTYAPSQLWYLAYQGAGAYSVTNANSNMAMQGHSNGGVPVQEPTSTSALQKFTIVSNNDGTYLFNYLNMTLDITSASTVAGATVNQDPYNASNPGNAHRFFIQPVSAPASTLVAGVSPNLPGPPLNLHYTASANGINVNWIAPAYQAGSTSLTYAATATTGGTTVNGTVSGTTASFTGLTTGSVYEVRITAKTGTGSGPAAGVQVVVGTLTAQTNLQVSNQSSTGFTLMWTDPNVYTSGVSPIYKFQLNGTSTFCNLTGPTTCVFSGLVAGSYQVGVAASVSGYTSTYTATTALTMLAAPTNQAATSIGNTGFTVNWSENNALGTETPAFTVAMDGATVSCSASTSTSCTITNAYSGYVHNVSVTETLGSLSATSATYTVTTTVNPLTNFSSSNVTTSAATISASDSNLYPSTPTYSTTYTSCSYRGSLETCISGPITSSTPSLRLTGLETYTTYNQTITVTSPTLTSQPSVSGSFKTHLWYAMSLNSVQSAPDGLSVSWTDPNAGTYLDSNPTYTVTLSNGINTLSIPTTSTSLPNITGLDGDDPYSVTVAVNDDSQTSPTSNMMTATTGLAAATGLSTSNVGPSGFTLSWTDPNPYVSGTTPAYVFTLNGVAASCTASGISCTFTGLQGSTAYLVGVAVTAGGISSTYSTTTVSTAAQLVPNPPTNLSVLLCHHVELGMEFYRLQFSWAAPNGGPAPTGYNLTYHSILYPYNLITTPVTGTTYITGGSTFASANASSLVATNANGSSTPVSFPTAGSCSY